MNTSATATHAEETPQATSSDSTPWNSSDDTSVATTATQFALPHTINLRFIVLNLVAFGLLGAAWAQGLIDKITVADGTRLSLLIFVVFLGGLILCGYRVFQVNRDVVSLNAEQRHPNSIPGEYLRNLAGKSEKQKGAITGSLRLQITQRIVLVRYIANVLVLLGLIGTVIGFIIALSGVDPKDAQNVAAIAPMVSTLIAGMSTALYTTLVGSVLNLWLMANYQILAHGTVRLITGVTTIPEDANA